MDNDEIKQMMGPNHTIEIFKLWYEVTYLRLLMAHIVNENPSLSHCINEAAFEKTKKQAQEVMEKRFAIYNLKLTNPESPPVPTE